MELIQKETVAKTLASLVRYGVKLLDLNDIDAIYAHNQLIDLFKIDEPCEVPEDFSGDLYKDILKPLCNYALQEKMIESYEVERFIPKIMGFVTPSPSAVIDRFDSINSKTGIRSATTWLYKIACNSAYINLPAINKNLGWRYPAKDGDIVITINSSRPEKDPKQIELAAKSPQVGYPKCMLCLENVGYNGRINHPARQNLRVIPIPLSDDSVWYMQYSPYRYFNEHCIFFNSKHEPMAMGEESFRRMVELLRNVPHYFIGSNAPLPIVGGSILAHDHFQGGAKEMPIFRAKPKIQYYHPQFPGVKFSIVNWYNSVIRIKCERDDQLVKAMTYVNDCWAKYSDPKSGIIAATDSQHNAITPVVHLERGELYAEMFLRNNRTDEKHPFGIFHPSEELHHIKKEGIGVIEVMGNFILPARLEKCIYQIRRLVSRLDAYDEEAIEKPEHPLYGFRKVIKLLMTNYDKESISKSDKCLLMYFSQRCEEILRATGVFKQSSDGLYAFQGFMRFMGMENQEFRENTSRQFMATERLKRDSSVGIENTHFMRNLNGEALDESPSKLRIALLAGEEDEIVKNVDRELVNPDVVFDESPITVLPKKRGRKPGSVSAKTNLTENAPEVEIKDEPYANSNVVAPAPKKRGRKTNAERERLRLLAEQRTAELNLLNSDKVDVSEDGQNSEIRAEINVDSVEIVTNQPTQTQTLSFEEPVKRKRGRPRKVVD